MNYYDYLSLLLLFVKNKKKGKSEINFQMTRTFFCRKETPNRSLWNNAHLYVSYQYSDHTVEKAICF